MRRQYDGKVEVGNMLMQLIKLPFKIVALPLLLVGTILVLLVKLISGLSSIILKPILLLLLIGGIFMATQQMWGSAITLAAIGAVGLTILFGAACVEMVLDAINGLLSGIVHS